MKIVTLVGSRCTYYRQKVLFQKMEADPEIDLHILVTNELLKNVQANIFSELMTLYKHTKKVTSHYRPTLKGMAMASAALQHELVINLNDTKPDLCLVIADRWEQLPFAIAASHLNIPLAHIQGGEVSGNIDDKVRNAISQLSDIHFPSHEKAADRLTDMRLSPVALYGCPSIDLIKQHGIKRNNTNSYVICIFHPHTKEIDKMEKQAKNVYETAKLFCKNSGLELYVFSGNNDPGADYVTSATKINNVAGHIFLDMLAKSVMIIGNSSAGIRESSYLGVPCVNIGDRQKNRVKTDNVTDTDSIPENIYKAMYDASKFNPARSFLFGAGDASENIIKTIKKWRKK
jgi:UDP-hydrolysing UDP-N-acetyl-D-glucosamine 2-epimerase